MNFLAIEIGRWIKYHRERLDMSQADLAASAFLTCSAISQFEKGKRIPSLCSFVQICKAMDLDTNEIIRDPSGQEPPFVCVGFLIDS